MLVDTEQGRRALVARVVVDATGDGDVAARYGVSIHDPRGSGHTTFSDRGAHDMPETGTSYRIPLGMCLNQRVLNLAVVGRCASSTCRELPSVRVHTHCMVMGHGVGTLAATALDGRMGIADVDTQELQRQLKADGAYLEDCRPEGAGRGRAASLQVSVVAARRGGQRLQAAFPPHGVASVTAGGGPVLAC